MSRRLAGDPDPVRGDGRGRRPRRSETAMSDSGPYTGSGHLNPDSMGSGEMTPEMLGARPCADEVSSLVQAVRDHARTTRRLTEVTAELKAANERLARVDELFNGGPDTPCRTTFHTVAAGTEWESELECVEVPLDDLRAALADPEGGT